MPRGGHKGGLFPVSGVKWGMHERVKKRGLYHNRREDIFTPRWGYRYENRNMKYLPDGSSKSFDIDVSRAWPNEKPRWNYFYNINESRYIWPSICAQNPDIKNYILNVLESSENRHFSGIGLEEVQNEQGKRRRNDYIMNSMNDVNDMNIANSASSANSRYKNCYLTRLANEFNNSIYPQIEVNLSNKLKRGRIQKLYDIVKEENIWKTTQQIKTTQSENIFPYVDDNSTLIRELPLSEILYTKSNLRLNVRRHPKWMNVQFLKKKVKIPYLYRRRVAREELQKKEFGSFF
ncbi:conserved Plasmodium protein, unknown function [Plasmodium malariae]|uniref:Uncharacterized protein n=1 Tax=Plasmodium malariae TaxID=5858 RepID=A0A1D3SP50_PLAMA|nr:conserved Plasmodium protein, unknown function [Plasmodium malariae]SCO93144.1 conserved Plasmodium protein, unknown function [Plasmodium malariae]